MDVSVEEDRVRIGPQEFVPRFATFLPDSLIVPAGETVTLPPDSTWNAIEVAGTLRVSRAHDTTVRFTHLLILPGGLLDVGTASSPVTRYVEFIVRDTPLDTERDPFQWGNGILNFGAQTRVGVAKTSFTELATDAPAGATQITLIAAPDNWQVGDELLFPDTRQATAAQTALPRRESTVTIAAIDDATVRLSKPLDFEHLSITDPDGQVVLRPRVANLTRNIVVRSENPQGRPGHTANIGPSASWDIRYNELRGLGRTTTDPLNNTSVDARGVVNQIGTNQIARYASHDHHTGTSTAVRQTIGNALVGGRKWGHVEHVSFDAIVEDNVIVGFTGAGIVTEDGHEARNVIRHNLVAYTSGSTCTIRGTSNCVQQNSPGAEMSGFWLRGVHNIIDRNESWNNTNGITLFNRDHVGMGSKFPSTKGGPSDTEATRLYLLAQVPMSFVDNVTAANLAAGVDYWSVAEDFPAVRLKAAHNGEKQVWVVNSGTNRARLIDPALIASNALANCIDSSAGYTHTVIVEGGRLAGCSMGIMHGGAILELTLRDVVLQNRRNLWMDLFPASALFENVVHKPLGTNPTEYIVMGRREVWDPSQPLPGPEHLLPWISYPSGSPWAIVNWQGTGQDYRLLTTAQLRHLIAWPARTSATPYYVPAEGMTVGEAWDRWNLALFGDVVDASEAVELEGVVGGVARPGLGVPLGPPRAVLTYPNSIAPAEPKTRPDGTQAITLYLTLTGDQRNANEVAVVQVDDTPPVRQFRRQGQREMLREVITSAGATPGVHTVRTWREDQQNVKIPASELTFTYEVETTVPASRSAPAGSSSN